ncbi:MAG: 2'-5' RNA ligase family protein [Eubacteriales bacterium]|nr:2'-5' RNA ligase family protein [Eubacteriales bacterium]
MYLISVYFDKKTTQELDRLIKYIARNTKNDFMIKHQVPPHLTIASFESKSIEALLEAFSLTVNTLKSIPIDIVSPGALLPYVMYAAPILSMDLREMNRHINAFLMNCKDVNVGKYYQPDQWLPHITLGKTLTKEEMQIAFQTLQQYFVPVRGYVTEIGIAGTNPHTDLLRVQLKP